MSVKYTSTVKVVIPQLVRCAYCDEPYVYEQTVTGIGCAETGLVTSERAAKKSAEADARKNLDHHLNDLKSLYNPVPCPACFKYQPYMHEALGRQKYNEYGCLGYFLAGLGGLAAVGGLVALFFVKAKLAVILVAVSGGLAWAIGYATVRRVRQLEAEYDANEHDPRGREKVAAERAMTPEEYDRKQAERVRKLCADQAGTPWDKGSQPPARAAEPSPFDFLGDGADGPEFGWWVAPTFFVEGGTVTIRLSKADHATVTVPHTAKPGDVFDLHTDSPRLKLFRVRLHAINTHPGEFRLEE